METPTKSHKVVLFSALLDLSLFWGVSRQNITRKMKRWTEKQYLPLRSGPCKTHRQTRELISGLIWLQGTDYYPLIGHNPGLLLA